MGNRIWKQVLATIVISATLAAPVASEAGQGRGRARGLQNKSAIRAGDTDRGRGTTSRVYQDPASVTGYESGYERGLKDGREGQRYDPVRYREYRDAEHGYADSYGSKDGYRANYRTGFRQGYEDGYRDGSRNRR